MDTNRNLIKIELYKIGFLVSMIHVLNLEDKIVKELLQTYYSGLEQGKINGFTDTEVIISDKPNLINYLMSQNIVPFGEYNNQDNKDIKINKKNIGGKL